MSKKNTAILLTISGIVFVLLSAIFFFFDLDISKSMASQNPNFIFLLLEAIGEFPIYIGPVMFGLVYGFTSDNKNVKLVSHFVGLIGAYVAILRLVSGILDVFYSSIFGILQYSLLAIVALLVYILLIMLFSHFKEENLYKIRDVALIYLIVTISSFVIVSLGKIIWGRVRFRALADDYSDFSNFLTLNFGEGINGDNYKSFPSGHTNAATSILMLGLIPSRISNKKYLKYLTMGSCSLYPIIVAISRIGVGAHYASDVLFGFTISVCCFITTYIIFKKKGWLYVRGN